MTAADRAVRAVDTAIGRCRDPRDWLRLAELRAWITTGRLPGGAR